VETMARFRQALMPINRIKHVVDFQTAVPVNVKISQIIAVAKDNPTLAGTSEVANGSKINGFFITTEIASDDTTTTLTPNFYWILYKNPGQDIATFPNGNSVGDSTKKKFVIHQEMVMFNPQDGGNPRNVFKGVIVVPKGMRRMAPDDAWVIQLFIPSTGVKVNACTQVHYKEFR